jgi:hypothetical protein
MGWKKLRFASAERGWKAEGMCERGVDRTQASGSASASVIRALWRLIWSEWRVLMASGGE